MNALSRGIAASVLLLSGLISGANAATLFQSIPDLTADANVVQIYCAPCVSGDSKAAFDSFTLGSASTINSIAINVDFSYLTNGVPTSVNVSVWTVSGGPPVTELLNETVAPNNFAFSAANAPYDLITLNVPAWALLAGTYDISITSPTQLVVPQFSGGSGLMYAYPGNSLVLIGGSMSFALYGDATVSSSTPLPAALPLFGTGLGALGLLARRRKRKIAAATAAI